MTAGSQKDLGGRTGEVESSQSAVRMRARGVLPALLLAAAIPVLAADDHCVTQGTCASTEGSAEMNALPSQPTNSGTSSRDWSQSLRDELGPVVINEDGSMRRITNWHEKSAREREQIVAVIGKRNQKRRAHLEELRSALAANASALAIIPHIVLGIAPEVLLDFTLEACAPVALSFTGGAGVDCVRNTADPSVSASLSHLRTLPVLSWRAPAAGSDETDRPTFLTVMMLALDVGTVGSQDPEVLWLMEGVKMHCTHKQCSVGGSASHGGVERVAYAPPQTAVQNGVVSGEGPATRAHTFVALIFRDANGSQALPFPASPGWRRAPAAWLATFGEPVALAAVRF